MTESIVRLLRQYRQFARKLREDGRLETAAAYYIASYHGNLMRVRPDPGWLSEEMNPTEYGEESNLNLTKYNWPTALGSAYRNLYAGCLCHRIAGCPSRCDQYANSGISFLRDIQTNENESISEPRLGLLWEIIGDLRVISDIGEANKAYNEAQSRYVLSDSDLGWSMEDDFDEIIIVTMDLADSADVFIEDDNKREQITRLSLDDRIRFKISRFENIIAGVLNAENWTSDVL